MITLAEAKAQLNIPTTNTTHDVELEAFVASAIGAVERYTGLTGEVVTISGERHVLNFSWRLWLHHKPVQSVTSVARVDGSQTWNVADLDVDVESGMVRVVNGSPLGGLLMVDYEAGYVQVPDRMALAARIIVQHLWTTQRGAMGGSSDVRAALEGSFDNLVGGGRGYAIPNAALELLGEPTPVVA